MDTKPPLEDPADTFTICEKVFKHPEGLLTARNLVRLLIHEKMEEQQPRTMQQTITNSFQVSRPLSGWNPTMPNALKQVLAFSDSPSQTFGQENLGGTNLSSDRSDNLETVERSHVKLIPFSNASPNLGDLFFDRQSSQAEHDTKQIYFPNTSYPSSSLQTLYPAHRNSSTPMISYQPQDQSGFSRLSQGEVQDNFHSSITTHRATSEHTFASDLSTIDRDTIDREYLGFNTMNQSRKPLSQHSSADPRQSSHKPIARPQNLLPAPPPPPQSHRIPRLCMQHAAAMSFPPLASKSSNDREVLQVVEGLAPLNSVSERNEPHSSSKSIGGAKQTKKPVARKRKRVVEGEIAKKPKLGKANKTKRTAKVKPERKELAKYQLDHAIWMRILEFTPVQFLGKARLICKEFCAMVDKFTSIYVNCRKENYGHDMPPPPLGLTERQYSNLLGSKGCLEPGCDDKKASRTHWSWAKRWCVKCWKSKIEREDRLIKNRADRFTNRTTLTKLLECIPVGMHDSFMKPHDYVDLDDTRPRGAPRLYKYYLKEDVEEIFRRYDALEPEPYVEDPSKTAEENAAGLARYQEELAGLDDKRAEFLADEKAKIDAHMELVKRIEAGVRLRRETNRTPYDENRNARKELFTRRAKEDLPHISEEFVKSSEAFKAATRVFRDGGTERGWQTLKPKIEKEWETSKRTVQENTSSNDLAQLDGAIDVDMNDGGDDNMTPLNVNIRAMRDPPYFHYPRTHISQQGRSLAHWVPRTAAHVQPSSTGGIGLSPFPGTVSASQFTEWRPQYPPSQLGTIGFSRSSTGNSNESSSTQISISSLLSHSTPSTSQTGNFFQTSGN